MDTLVSIKGAITALITPFKDGKIDFSSLEKIIEFQINNGISGLVVSGTTGESATLADPEKSELFSFAVKTVNGRVPVIGGTGTNSTDAALRLTESATRAGCDALLVVTPYYNKASPDGLYKHYSKLASRTPLPIIAYNVPSRTGVSIPIDVLKSLYCDGSIAGLKEASGDISRVAKIAEALPHMAIYSGNDDQILPIMSLGGKGVVSVVSNALPKETAELCRAAFAGDFKKARELQLNLLPIINLLFADVNPIAVKYIMYKMGLCRLEYRLPLTPPTKELCLKLDGLIESGKLKVEN